MIGTIQDVTDIRTLEIEAHENREALARLERTATLVQLAGAIAHELNQPLTGILGSGQAGEMLLKRGDGNRTEIEEILTEIIADTKRSGDIIRNIRDLFVKQETEFNRLDVNAIVEETLRLLNSEFVIHGLTVQQDFCNTLPDVMGNKIQLQQVLINLINNAKQAMQNVATADRSIAIVTERGNEGEVQVRVEDTGLGIDQERLKRIFEAFITFKPGGLGMGLAISRSIVKAHDGRIWAENRPAGETRISFLLPVVEKNDD